MIKLFFFLLSVSIFVLQPAPKGSSSPAPGSHKQQQVVIIGPFGVTRFNVNVDR